MLPTREEALKLIRDGLLFNPGPWGKHCLTAAHCAEKIASACGDMDVEKAYILGLLHDIGRKFGVRHLGHVYDGYVYMKSLGYDEVAKICLTHSFNNHTIDEYIGKFDVTDEEWDKAMDAFKYVFDLKGNPQMPYFIRVAGMAAIKKLEEQNAELGIIEAAEAVNINAMDIGTFKNLSTDDKLVEIYKLLTLNSSSDSKNLL